MKKVLILLLITAFFLGGCANKVESTPDEAGVTATIDQAAADQTDIEPVMATVSETEAAPTQAEPSFDDLALSKFNRILNTKPSGYAVLDDVHALNQMYGMQAGCEALALTAALSHFGYDLDIDEIVDNYLVYDSNFAIGYCGDPHLFYDGSGIYPPGMVTTAWNFIEDNDADLYPFDTTGLSLDELYSFLDAGCPALIWTTYDRSFPYIEFSSEYDGVYYPWYETEHCVCLFGYDQEDNQVKIADSWGGVEYWEDASHFEDVYDEIGQFSMVLMDTKDIKQR